MSEPVGNSPRGDIPGNSHRARAAEPAAVDREPVNKIVSGKVTIKKAPWFKRMGRSLLADDASNVGDFVISDVLAPAIRNLIFDIINQGSSRVLFGTARNRRAGTGTSAGPVSSLKTKYHRSGEEVDNGRSLSQQSRARHDFDPITLETRGEVVEVIEELTSLIEQYGSASVADLYSLLGVSGSFADRAWGWRNLNAADVRQTRSGFLLDLPSPIQLGNS